MKHTGNEEEDREGQRGKERERPLWRKVKYSFFGCCNSCRALFLDPLVRGERWKKNMERGKEGEKRLKLHVRVAR